MQTAICRTLHQSVINEYTQSAAMKAHAKGSHEPPLVIHGQRCTMQKYVQRQDTKKSHGSAAGACMVLQAQMFHRWWFAAPRQGWQGLPWAGRRGEPRARTSCCCCTTQTNNAIASAVPRAAYGLGTQASNRLRNFPSLYPQKKSGHPPQTVAAHSKRPRQHRAPALRAFCSRCSTPPTLHQEKHRPHCATTHSSTQHAPAAEWQTSKQHSLHTASRVYAAGCSCDHNARGLYALSQAPLNRRCCILCTPGV